MSASGYVLHQLRYEQRIFWRTPAATFFTVALPVLLLVVFATVAGDGTFAEFGGEQRVRYHVPSVIVFGLVTACYGNLAARFVARRELGLLKRVRATPVPLATVIGGIVASAVAVAAIVVAFILLAAATAYDTTPERWTTLAATLVVGAASFCAIGIAVSTLIPNTDSTDPIIIGTYMPLVFISGGFGPVPEGSTLTDVASLFPIRHLLLAALAGFGLPDGQMPWSNLAVIAAWGVAATIVAMRGFRWEPRRR